MPVAKAKARIERLYCNRDRDGLYRLAKVLLRFGSAHRRPMRFHNDA